MAAIITLTTGKISKYLGIAPRTVSKWVDSGVLKGMRLPGSQDCRIMFDDFVVFCRSHGYPVPNRNMTVPRKIYIYGATKLEDYHCFDSTFELGRACANDSPRLIVVIENDVLLKELKKFGYPVLNGNDMTYNEIAQHLKGLDSVSA